MPVVKNLDVEILERTWPSSVPLGLVGLSGTWDTHLPLALLFTALWTRPPAQYGFSLSDCWAWLRYFPAVHANNRLRLRAEWTDLDPYHKIVLSADFGVGFSTLFLHQTLGFVQYADTLRVIKVLAPHLFQPKNVKRGQWKSPDYIALDATGRYSVVECKGNQTSRDSLKSALARGANQKANVGMLGGAGLLHSLVTGVFIPQWSNPEPALIAVADPEWEELLRILDDYPPERIVHSTRQIGFAKEAALFGLTATANRLSRVEGAAGSVREALAFDLAGDRRNESYVSDDLLVSEREYRWPEAQITTGRSFRGVRYMAVVPLKRLEQVARFDEDLGDQVGIVRDFSSALTTRTGDAAAFIRSPLGADYGLELLE